MGGVQGKLAYYQTTSIELEKDLSQMITDYKFWTDESICNKIEVFYYDKLIKFHKKDLLDISTSIGIIYDTDTDKRELCNIIIQNYKAKLDIVKIIYDAVIKVNEKLDYATHGSVCRCVDEYINDFINCQKYNGQWIGKNHYDELVKKHKNTNKYELWTSHIISLQKKHEEYINKLKNFVDKIKLDISNTMTIEELVEIKNNVTNTIKTYDHITNVLYLLIINIE